MLRKPIEFDWIAAGVQRFSILRFNTLGRVRSAGAQLPNRGLSGSSHSGIRILRLKSTLGGSSTRMFRNTGVLLVPNIVPGTINEAMTALFWPFRFVLLKLGLVGFVQSV